MKTVMKKMFSLLLVAVLLVGVMPFQAFADGTARVEVIVNNAGTGENATIGAGPQSANAIKAAVNYTADGIVTDFCVTDSNGGNMVVFDETIDVQAGGQYLLWMTVVPNSEPEPEPETHTCGTCGQTYTGTTHTCPQCSFSGCVLTQNHSGEHQCACGMYPQKGSGHNTSCTYYEANNKTYSLKVWAKLWVGSSLNKTILLDEFTDLDGTEVVPYIIGNNVSRLESKFPSGYNNIEWTKAVYYYIDSNTTGTVDTNMNVNEEDNVYINLYSQEKLFVVNVHLGKYYGIDSTVKVGGFRVGETVSYDDVLKAVKKQYNVSSLKMYTYDNWCKVVEGKTSSASPYFQVHDGDNVYEVYVSGSRKTTSASGSSSATADSSNPKTGDMIFAPVAVMGLSISALAVLFFLNKKRAY